jgi:hypothetical protein
MEAPTIPGFVITEIDVDERLGIRLYSYRRDLTGMTAMESGINRNVRVLLDHRPDGTWRASMYLGTALAGLGRGDTAEIAVDGAIEYANR